MISTRSKDQGVGKLGTLHQSSALGIRLPVPAATIASRNDRSGQGEKIIFLHPNIRKNTVPIVPAVQVVPNGRFSFTPMQRSRFRSFQRFQRFQPSIASLRSSPHAVSKCSDPPAAPQHGLSEFRKSESLTGSTCGVHEIRQSLEQAARLSSVL
jgi:hypothetical protein